VTARKGRAFCVGRFVGNWEGWDVFVGFFLPVFKSSGYVSFYMSVTYGKVELSM